MDGDLWAEGRNSKFISNALNCINLQLVRHKRELIECQHGYDDDCSFHPEYAHQIFGQKELIFGYRDLIVNIHFLACSMKCLLNIKYREKVKSSDLEPTNIEEVLKKYLPENFTTDSEQFIEWLRAEKSVLWGETVRSYMKESEDAGNSIDLNNDRWEIFITFEEYLTSDKQKRYAPIAFCTLFKFYAYLDKIRPRVSQLLVLPPFQRRGHGSKMLDSVYNYFNKDDVKDITAEIPNADFVMVRDILLTKWCSKLQAFAADKLATGFTQEMYTEGNIRTKASVDSLRRVYYILRIVSMIKNEKRDDIATLKNDIKSMLTKKHMQEKIPLKNEERIMQEELLDRCVEDTYLTFEATAEAFLRHSK
ncbi:hypothetical protein GJ496_002245 [Pomphorhynchus laevis]|nr:hypothetical protein GJ496_002245 [Pomphorhynchus laevis]